MAKLKIITMQDVQAEPADFLWKPYIPLGKISIVQGDPGDGKTTLLLAIAAAVTKGAVLPGGGHSDLANVIFQTAEDGLADTIKPRLEQLGANCSRVHVVDEDEKSLSLSDERIEQAIIQMDAKLFILDPLQAYLGGADMHSAGGVRPLMKSLGAVAERTGCAIVIIGHLNKRSGKAQYRGLGSIDIYAAARSVLTVGRLDEGTRAMVHGKSNLAPPGVPQAFSFDPIAGFTWHGDCDVTLDELLSGKGASPKPENQLDKAKRFLESVLEHDAVPAVKVQAMAQERGISSKTLTRAKEALGVISIKRGDKWYWQIPITVEYEECQDGQDSQPTTMTALTILPRQRATA